MPYEWLPSTRRYRDADTKRFVSRNTVMRYVSQITSAGSSEGATLARLVSGGELSPADFGIQLRQEVKSTFIQQYILGRGGRQQMTPRDWGSVGRLLREQYRRINNFVRDIETKNLTEGQIRVRAEMYFQTSRSAYERGNAGAYGVTLPSYPGDETQTCYGGCQCAWRLEEDRDEDGNLVAILAFWELNELAEHCEADLAAGTRGCVQNAAEYNPLVIPVSQ